MTRTRWLAACAVTLLLSGSSAWAQAPCCGMPCAPQSSEAARAPYFDELPHILFPAQGPVLAPHSNPVVWARLFEAIASNRCRRCVACEVTGACSPCANNRNEAHNRRMVCELLKLYRVFYREGHYHAAEIVASRALQLDPSNCAAELAVGMARLATDAIDHCCSNRGDAEDCESAAAPAPCCGICVSKVVMMGGCKAAAKGCCGDGKACCTKASCACGEKCACAKDEPCACGKDCCCKKSAKQNVLKYRRLSVPVPVVMCPFCPEFQVALPHPVPAMVPHPMPGVMPHPMPGMMPPPPHAMPPHAVPNAAWAVAPPMCVPPCPVMAAEVLPAPRIISNPMPGTSLTSTSSSVPVARSLQITVCGKQVRLVCPCLQACCDSVKALPDGRALLEGNVAVTFTCENRPAKIRAARMIVDLEDGSYEVSPERIEALGIQPISYCEGATYWVKHKRSFRGPVKAIAPVPCVPCCPFPCVPCSEDR